MHYNRKCYIIYIYILYIIYIYIYTYYTIYQRFIMIHIAFLNIYIYNHIHTIIYILQQLLLSYLLGPTLEDLLNKAFFEMCGSRHRVCLHKNTPSGTGLRLETTSCAPEEAASCKLVLFGLPQIFQNAWNFGLAIMGLLMAYHG